jgi:HKD family nuclease
MTAENNLILGNKLINCLKTGTEFNLSIDEFATPSNKEFYLR